jgi:DNA-binding beta-propeller fold protein YncE
MQIYHRPRIFGPGNTDPRHTHGYRALIRALRRMALTLCLLNGALFMAGCASTPKMEEFVPPVYPPPPADPRFIYERTLLFSSNVEDFTTGDAIKLFATGESRKIQALVKPYGVAVYHGRVYVTDTVDREVMVFDIAGKRFFIFGDRPPGELHQPHGIAIAPARGEVYVCDNTSRRVMVYDLDGKFLRSLGSKKVFDRPTGIAASPDGTKLYVVDTGGLTSMNHHVVVLDSTTGEVLQTIGSRGNGPGQFNLPLLDAVGPDGTLYVVDGGNFRVEAFNPDGTFKLKFGGVGRLPGQFARPKGIATDKEGNVYVVDTAFGNFQIFNPQGQLLMFVGSRGEAAEPGKFMLPAGIAVDEDGRVYVVDQFFRKVDVFRPYALKRTDGYAGVIEPRK